MQENKINIKKENGKTFIYCQIRKKWIILTPEEKVRQFLIDYFVTSLQYPLNYISVEKQIKVNQLKKRYDIVVYNQELQAHILVECKANSITINHDTLKQLLNYNISIAAPFLMISNGTQHHIFELNEGQFKQIDKLPSRFEIFT